MVQNPPMVFKIPPVRDQYGSLGGSSQHTRSAASAPSFTVARAPKQAPRKDSFKTQRQLKEEEEQKALLKLKIRCRKKI